MAFSQRYPRVVVGYSYKTNYLPYICRLARNAGAYAEVVSRLEADLALRIGCPPEEIIFNGPVKRGEDIELALERGMILNLDTSRELARVMDYARRQPGEAIGIGLRLNIPLIDEEGKSHLQEGMAVGRFGFSPDALAEAARQLRKQPNIRVHSLHGHVSSTSRSLWVYRTIVNTLADAAAHYFPETIEYLDIGGGFFGRRVPAMGLTDSPTYDDYAEAICRELLSHPWASSKRPRLVIEPGMAVVADTMSYLTRVFDVKSVGGRRLAVTDGTFFNVKPTMHRRNHPFEIIKENPRGPREVVSVVGATCMEKDCLLQDIECEGIDPGDFIRIDNVGAYTVVLTPPFIHPAPPVLVRGRSGFVPIRRRQSFEDFFCSCNFIDEMEDL